MGLHGIGGLLTLGRPGTRGAANWSPLALGTLVAWYDASDLTTLYQASDGSTPATSDGDVVGRISDKSGNGWHLLQATTGNKPLLKRDANGINGLATVMGDGVDDIMKTAAIALNQPVHMLVVIRSAYLNGRVIFDGLVNESMQVYYTTPSPRLHMYAGSANACGNSELGGTAVGILSVVANGALSSIAVNGGTPVTGSPGTRAPGGLTLFNKSSGTSPSAIAFGEGLLLSAALDSTNYAAALTYLATKWGVTLA